jgi:hypothetical protein
MQGRARLLVWALPAVLLATAVYELVLMVWGSYPRGLEPGESVSGEATVAQIAYVVMLLAAAVAVGHALGPQLPAAVALFVPAATTFSIARFYTYDPYYFPTLRRYSDERPGAVEALLFMISLSLAAAVLTRRWPRIGSAVTAVALPLVLFTSLILSDGH